MKTPFTTILWTGFLVGLLDGIAAIVNFLVSGGGNPVRIFYYIASGVFGKTAFVAGNQMLFWGLLFHFMIAYIFTAFYFWLYPKVNFFSTHVILSGMIYGIVVWIVMNLLVLPLSNTPKLPFSSTQAIIGIGIHMFLVGLPISLLMHQYFTGYQHKKA
ncbi:DUF1440 domain-containing protein [Rhodocytophaga rosea]|uniref:DUF1440 domain-containing protein n=1 Tax=Rhodocytophaga rosea TaxID=2704465 RepID=A0A6C0GJR8_9BACT|nr:DUF1440 domain-containing protein [Rhodocytophaga rosea]QHT68321.1 DUF1440 domain-containing protein [Rhodocytophaga rosea]